MSSWDDQPVGTWELYQFNQAGSGQTTRYGYFSSYRSAVEAARAIAKISTLTGTFNASYKRSDKREGAMVDGFTSMIDLPLTGEYNPHVEIVMPDGKKIWLEDLLAKIEKAVAA